ncbi:anaerobic ribonucleoside-triphosphate reductase [Corynebacterium lubricantis]|uniref:anaerobic ribonucleoside-triphosphate reductase n=1 Tax=Corynebacterium lubricantis TaxID=541095 RepID=UPI00037D0B46|nr:anaerobic ribonucleoside-triphosphate reductase [Corynebacterium lubricantis]
MPRFTKVKKRDGRIVAFRPSNIKNVVASVTRDTKEIAASVARHVEGKELVSAQEITALLEEELEDEPGAVKAMRIFAQAQREKFAQSTDERAQLAHVGEAKVRNENGNKDSRTFIVQRDLVAGTITKAKGLAMFPEGVRAAHVKGLIHIHDLDRSPYQSMPNCSLPDFEFLLENGFTLGNARIESPQSIGVAATLIVQLLGAISGEQYGGISVHEIDRLLEPYAAKTHEKNRALFREVTDEFEAPARKKTKKDIYDAMQTFEYQVNTLTTSAAQTPFTSISFGQTTSWLGREIQKSILNIREKGMSGETAIFPKLLFFVDEGINKNPEDPNYDIKQLAMRCSRKRIYPDMIAAPRIREIKEGQLITPMGCRSFLHPWRNENGHNQLAGRNNLGVVSLNLPHLALQAEKDQAAFFKLLDETMDLVLQALKIREDGILAGDLAAAPIMYTQGGLGNPAGKTTVRDFYTGEREKASSISVGYIGVHNAMVALTGNIHWHDDAQSRKLSRLRPIVWCTATAW